MNKGPVSFSGWKLVLAHAEISPMLKVAYPLGNITFLRHCR